MFIDNICDIYICICVMSYILFLINVFNSFKSFISLLAWRDYYFVSVTLDTRLNTVMEQHEDFCHVRKIW